MEWEKETRRTKDAQGKTMQRSRHKTQQKQMSRNYNNDHLSVLPSSQQEKIMYSMHEQEQNAVKGNV